MLIAIVLGEWWFHMLGILNLFLVLLILCQWDKKLVIFPYNRKTILQNVLGPEPEPEQPEIVPRPLPLPVPLPQPEPPAPVPVPEPEPVKPEGICLFIVNPRILIKTEF